MKKIITAFAALIYLCISYRSFAQKDINKKVVTADGDTILLGHCKFSALQEEPFSKWFVYNADTTHIDTASANRLKKILKHTKLEIFMGTWCGDSRREVPQLYKLLKYIHYPEKNIRLILVNNSTEHYKQSPQHEESGKNIFRVPCVLVYKKDSVIGRVIEFPKESWAKDLYKIAKGEEYTPNYFAGFDFMNLLNNKKVNELQKDTTSLISSLKQTLSGRSELNAVGYVYYAMGDTAKTMFTFLMNYAVYPNEPRAINSLAFVYNKTGDYDKAKELYNKTLTIDPENKTAKEGLEMLSQ